MIPNFCSFHYFLVRVAMQHHAIQTKNKPVIWCSFVDSHIVFVIANTMLINGKERIHSTNTIGNVIKRENVENAEPAPMEKLNWLIHLQHIRGETKSCKELINLEIARSEGRNEYAFFKQGIILKTEGNIQEALETFQKCLRINPQNVVILKELATCLYDMRRFRLALNAYQEAESLLKNSDWQLYYFIAQCYMKLGNMDMAKEYAHKSVKVGKQEESYAILIKILMDERDLRSAVSVANAAVESCPESVNLLTQSGLLYLKIGQTQFAFERLSQALALEPTCAKALLGIGYITQKHEEYEVGLTKYKIAVLYEPESVALWNNIGMCFHAKEKQVAAISCLKRGLWIAPLNWKILFNLGLVHLATHQPASGFNFACAAVNLRPEVAECFALLGYTLFELKDTENALRAFKQAYSLAPNDVTMTINVALLLEVRGLFNESGDLMKKFKTLEEEGQTVPNEVLKLADNLRKMQDERQLGQIVETKASIITEELKDPPLDSSEDIMHEDEV